MFTKFSFLLLVQRNVTLQNIYTTLGDTVDEFSITVCNELLSCSKSGNGKKFYFVERFLQLVLPLRHFDVE